jgi:MSHA biogenesis protein MshN
MSLINQMLKDLEQRGAGPNDAEQKIISNLNASQIPSVLTSNINHRYQAKHGVPFLKISGMMVLLAGGAYLWFQSGPALSQSIFHLKELTAYHKPQAGLNPVISDTASKQTDVITPVTPEKSTALQPFSLFENSLNNLPVVAQTNKLQKNNEKNTVVATLAHSELLPDKLAHDSLANTNITAKLSELTKPIEVIEPTNNQVAIEKSIAAAKPPVHSNNNSISKLISPDQKSSNAYRQALINLQQGRVAEAQNNLMQSLDANPANQEARQTLAGLLIENNRNDEARAILATGLSISPEQTNFRIALARLQVELGDQSGALKTLDQGLTYAENNADYHSFLATLLQRANRHDEAIVHYNTALSINSGATNSLIGLGISFQAVGKLENAQEVFNRAQAIATLSPELAQFVDQQLKQINQHLQSSTTK